MPSSTTRLLKPSDEAALIRFFKQQEDHSLFLKYNLLRGGLNYSGKPGQGLFWGVVRNGEITSVMGLTWNGHLQLLGPEQIDRLCESLKAFLRKNNRSILGANGCPEYVRPALKQLGLENQPVQWDKDETLYSLALEKLITPAPLAQNDVKVRKVSKEDFNTLVQWQIAYACEALGESHSTALVKKTEKRIRFLIDQASDDTHILEADYQPVSRTNFTARTEDMVMIGGVWTPPEERNKGYAKAVVAASLIEARQAGIRKALLYTHSPFAAKAYTSIGFKKIGAYSLVLLKEPWTPQKAKLSPGS